MSWAERDVETRGSPSWVVKFATHHTSTVLITLECIVDDSEGFLHSGFELLYSYGAIEARRLRGRERRASRSWVVKFATQNLPMVLSTLKRVLDYPERFLHSGIKLVYSYGAILCFGRERLGEEGFTKLGRQICYPESPKSV